MAKKETKPHQKWGKCIELMLEGKLNQKQIAEEIRVSEQTIINWKKNSHFQELKFKMERSRLKDFVADALNNLIDLANNAESETVRLNATRDILDRVGHKPVDEVDITSNQEVNLTHNPFKELSSDELKKLIDLDE